MIYYRNRSHISYTAHVTNVEVHTREPARVRARACAHTHTHASSKLLIYVDNYVFSLYTTCTLSGVDHGGLTTCVAKCLCDGKDCKHATIHIPEMHEDWEICEITVE